MCPAADPTCTLMPVGAKAASVTHLPHDRRRGEPGVFLQDAFGEVLLQPCEVAQPHVGQVLTVVHAGRLISGHEAFDEPAAQNTDKLFYIEQLYHVVADPVLFTYLLMTLTAQVLLSRSFLAIKPLQQFSIFVAILVIVA